MEDAVFMLEIESVKTESGGGGMVFRPELDCGAQAEYFSATINREVRKVQKVAAREQN